MPIPSRRQRAIDAVLDRAASARGIGPRKASQVDPSRDVDRPTIVTDTILVAATPRTGSSLLVDGLAEAGYGSGDELWSVRAFGDGERRWGVPAMKSRSVLGQARRIIAGEVEWWVHGRFSEAEFRRYHRLIEQHRTTPNGCFVVKLFVEDVERLEQRLGMSPFDVLSGEQHWVRLHREDELGQAISLYRAKHTHQWRADTPSLRTFDRSDVDGADLAEIRRLIDRARSRDERWSAIFDRAGIEPMIVTYEELVESLGEVLGRVVEPIGGTTDISVEPPLERQADELSDALRERMLDAYPELAGHQ